MISSSDVMKQVREDFRLESAELVEELDSALLTLEEKPECGPTLNRVFRAIHTLKGSGGMAGFRALAQFCHGLEEALDEARVGLLPVSNELIDCSLRASDVIRRLLALPDGEEKEVPGQSEVLARVERLRGNRAAAPATAAAGEAVGVVRAWEIVFRPAADIFRSGVDPVAVLASVLETGSGRLTVRTEQLPGLKELDAEVCHLWWEMRLATAAEETALRELFDFVADDSLLSIRPLEDQAGAVAFLTSAPLDALVAFEQEIQRAASALAAGEWDGDGWGSLAAHAASWSGGWMEALGPEHPWRRLEELLRVLGQRTALPGAPGAVAAALGDWVSECRTLRPVATPHQDLRQSCGLTPLEPGADALRRAARRGLESIRAGLAHGEAGGAAREPWFAWREGLEILAALAGPGGEAEGLAAPVADQLRLLERAMAGNAEWPAEEWERLRVSAREVEGWTGGGPDAAEAGASGTEPNSTGTPAPRGTPATIRVDQAKLDRLMRVVGELLVARTTIPELAQRLARGAEPGLVAKDLKDAGSAVARLADELQASVMAIRMLPVRTIFQRFPRLVRELARELGKEVQFTMEGEAIELDKTILEQMGDPLVHLVRNALDHGLELPERRQAAGKSPVGRLFLRARQEAGAVMIEVADDGRGLNAEALRRKAVERGQLTPEAAATMSDAEAYQLIFLPGLSTASQVTGVSGRGVGMDVVRANIHALQGSIQIRSTLGAGAAFEIRLPTSLMVSKGILVEAGGQEYLLPLGAIRDMVKLPVEQLRRLGDTHLVAVRGRVHPTWTLPQLLGDPGQFPSVGEVNVALLAAGEGTFGLIVERFVSEAEVIIKPLTGGLEHCQEFQGAAIMGDGRVVLALQPGALYRLGQRASQAG